MPDLAPCPFCGSSGEELMMFCDPEEGRDNTGSSRRVQCAGCHVEAPFYSTKAEAIAAWNRRAPAPRQTGETFAIEHDDFVGTVQGGYVTREGKRGVVLQQLGTRVVHVYGEKWLTPVSSPRKEGSGDA